jgi:hypothetical protein
VSPRPSVQNDSECFANIVLTFLTPNCFARSNARHLNCVIAVIGIASTVASLLKHPKGLRSFEISYFMLPKLFLASRKPLQCAHTYFAAPICISGINDTPERKENQSAFFALGK